jgi:hypothetical protein
MSSLNSALEKFREKNDYTNAQMWETLGLDPGLGSRVKNGVIGVSHGLISRMLVKLTADDARAVLQGYFTDELERIRIGREAKAVEVGVTLSDADWPHRVKVVAAASPRASK